MTIPILYLFPDTNLFIQCLPLDQLDWSELGDFQEIHLLVSRPVQQEIDRQKNQGNNRLAKRARKTSSLFRQVIDGKSDYKLVNGDPPVKLSIHESSLPNADLSDVLDYSMADDRIVGCCHRYKEENPSLDVRLLTHDTGPMMSAKSVRLPFIPINDDWLLQPEQDESERKIAKLETELIRFRRAEPQFEIWCLSESGEAIDFLEITCKSYEPLSEKEVSRFLIALRELFPIATCDPVLEQKPIGAIFGELKYVPPASTVVSKYTKEDYPGWLNDCKSVLLNLHGLLYSVESPRFSFEAQNQGTRPARDSLVIISAKGNFSVLPPTGYFSEEGAVRRKALLRLPCPPQAPQGRWVPSSRTQIANMLSSRVGKVPLELADYTPVVSDLLRDSSEFYFIGHHSKSPSKSFRLECKRWRHQEESKPFGGYIFVEGGVSEARGALEFEIHAENLSEPVKEIIPVRISIERLSATNIAQQLINDLNEQFSETQAQ